MCLPIQLPKELDLVPATALFLNKLLIVGGGRRRPFLALAPLRGGGSVIYDNFLGSRRGHRRHHRRRRGAEAGKLSILLADGLQQGGAQFEAGRLQRRPGLFQGFGIGRAGQRGGLRHAQQNVVEGVHIAEDREVRRESRGCGLPRTGRNRQPVPVRNLRLLKR